MYTSKNKARGEIKGRNKSDRLVINVRVSLPVRIIQNYSTEYLRFFRGDNFTDTKFRVVSRR